MSLTRSLTRAGSFDPFKRAVNDIFSMMERDFAQPAGSLTHAPSSLMNSGLFPYLGAGSTRSTFGMNLDLRESAGGFEISADLPGMRKEDISIDVDAENNILTLSGERKQEREENEEGADGKREYHYMERSYGKTTRSIRLPESADLSKANAAYEQGVLHLSFPKRAALPSSRFKIPISDGGAGGGGNIAIGGKEGAASAGGMEES